MKEQVWKAVNQMAAKAEAVKDDSLIILMANVKEQTKPRSDYRQTSAISEFYSMNQYNDIFEALTWSGYRVKSYFDEIKFISDYSLDLSANVDLSNIVVINSAQQGIHPGRKSLIPAFCDLMGIVHTGSDAYVVSFAREKIHWGSFGKHVGLPICDLWAYDKDHGWLTSAPPSGEEVIVKLSGESSSIGLNRDCIFSYSVEKDHFLSNHSRIYDKRLLVSSFIKGYEVEVPLIRTPDYSFAFSPTGVSVDGKRFLDDVILDYQIRGDHKFSYYCFEEEISSKVAQEMQRIAVEAAKVFNIKGLGRIDFRVQKDGSLFITDISTNPHLTKKMTFDHVFLEAGYEYADVFKCLIGTALSWGEHQ